VQGETYIQGKAVVAAALVLRGKLEIIDLPLQPKQPQVLAAGMARPLLFPVLALPMAAAAALVQATILYLVALAVLVVAETVLMRLMPQVLMEQQIEVVAVAAVPALAQ